MNYGPLVLEILKSTCEYYQEMPQSQTTDQPTALGQDSHRLEKRFLEKSLKLNMP